mgnify:CR=1 FL=1
MRALIQRVLNGQVRIQNRVVARIGKGLVVFLGISSSDNPDDSRYLVEKIVNLRLFPNDTGQFEESIVERDLEILVVSQFTLYAETRRGRRPSFIEAASSATAKPMFEEVILLFKNSKIRVSQGVFGADMIVKLENDGPVTIFVDTQNRHTSRR